MDLLSAKAAPRPLPQPAVPRLFCLVLAALAPAGAAAQASTQEGALRLAFPTATIVRRTAFLDDEQRTRAAKAAGAAVEMGASVVTYYLALSGGEPVGVAYFDAHRVRTLPEVLMFAVGTDDRIRRIELVRFAEPPEYRAPGGWLEQFAGRGLDEDLSLKRGIANITGATLTARAVTEAARRVLALHTVIAPFGQGRQ